MYVKVIPQLIARELSVLLCILLLLWVCFDGVRVHYVDMVSKNKFTCLYKSIIVWSCGGVLDNKETGAGSALHYSEGCSFSDLLWKRSPLVHSKG